MRPGKSLMFFCSFDFAYSEMAFRRTAGGFIPSLEISYTKNFHFQKSFKLADSNLLNTS